MKLFRDRYCPVSSTVPEVRREQCDALLELRRVLPACRDLMEAKTSAADTLQQLVDAYRRWDACHKVGDPVSMKLISAVHQVCSAEAGLTVDRQMIKREPLRLNEVAETAWKVYNLLDEWM